MSGLVKNQLLKHLSRYMKNLSSDKINLSTFRGEGELSNLELDEDVLTELLELPSWLKLTSAFCNHVTIRISWTKLKKVPVVLCLDEVNITVETCEIARVINESLLKNLEHLNAPQGKYGFANKVIDGITLMVNTVNIHFKSPAFGASVQISKIRVDSKSPRWLPADLTQTRLKDMKEGLILIFKELTWQTVRIEASSTMDKTLTPLRLLTNQARCRITIKKSLTDCSILSSRLVLILDDLLWVFTDSQLKAALHFMDSLGNLIKTSTQVTQKKKAQKKLEMLHHTPQPTSPGKSDGNKAFQIFDVKETSYHFYSQKIDLLICDDIEGGGRSCHPNLANGGSLRITLNGYQVDYYPFHIARSSRVHWPKYKESSIAPALWLQESMEKFETVLLSKVQEKNLFQNTQGNLANSNLSEMTPEAVFNNLSKLMAACVIMRIEDFAVHCVSKSDKGKKFVQKEFIAGDKARYSLTSDFSTIHAEFTYFYYPSDFIFPLPPSKVFAHLNPLLITFDMDTILWMNSFALNMQESFLQTSVGDSMNSPSEDDAPSLMYMDVKAEAIMPRIVIEAVNHPSNQKDRPKLMQINVSRFAITNVREDGSSRAVLASALRSLQEGSLIFNSGFPSIKNDLTLITERILNHVSGEDMIPQAISNQGLSAYLTRYTLWDEPRDIWCIKLDPLWLEFGGTASVGLSKMIPFIDAVPITLWLHGNTVDTARMTSADVDNNTRAVKLADFHIIIHFGNLISVQVDHYQFLFLMRLAEQMNELSMFLQLDSAIIEKLASKSDKSIVMGCVIPQLEVTLVMPSQTPGKELSGDGESVIPDSASIGDEILYKGTSMATNDHYFDSRQNSMNPLGSLEHHDGVDDHIQFANSPLSHGRNVTIQSESIDIKASSSSAIQSNSIAVSYVNDKSTRKDINPESINITKELSSGLSFMKKGFSNIKTSIDIIRNNSISDDLSDIISFKSDVSSDSENFTLLGNSNEKISDYIDGMFRVNMNESMKGNEVEVAAEVCEEETTYKTNMSSPSEPSESCHWKRRDLVSMTTFRLSMVEFIKQNINKSSSIRVQVSAVSANECPSIPWDELQTEGQSPKETKFAARCKAWNVVDHNPNSTPCIKLRLSESFTPPSTFSSLIEPETALSWNKQNVDIKVEDLNLCLQMSSVIGLTELIEDEKLPRPLPASINLLNVKINLTDDRPPVNITSPGPNPVNLDIPRLTLLRNESGVIIIAPNEENSQTNEETCDEVNSEEVRRVLIQRDREVLALQLKLQQIQLDNERLKLQMQSHEHQNEEHKVKSKQENNMLRKYLKEAQENVNTLLDEKRSLLETVRSLQQPNKHGGKGNGR